MKASLAAAVARSGMDEKALLKAATKEAFERITLLLSSSFADFTPEQQRRIRAAVGANATPAAARTAAAKKPKADDATPRFWLPHSGATWSGRGRAPQAFLAWEGTVAHTEWKKHHPNERFPKYPG
jgi:DNA-binding protein H-NS